MLEREKVTTETVATETVENMTATTANIENLEVTSMTLRNVANVLYPVGSYYWSTDYTEPSKLFGGTWVQITNTFLFASTSADASAKTATAGETHHTLTSSEVPTHNHGITDYGHTHSIYDPGHSHSVRDPGHMHSLRTIGDDYNGSGRCGCQGGTGNLVQDGWSDMSGENWRRGIWANGNTTGISIHGSYSNISINGNKSGLSINYSGGGQPHNNMPPYIRAYCWHRIG
jgi:microcystin-dependent protein